MEKTVSCEVFPEELFGVVRNSVRVYYYDVQSSHSTSEQDGRASVVGVADFSAKSSTNRETPMQSRKYRKVFSNMFFNRRRFSLSENVDATAGHSMVHNIR